MATNTVNFLISIRESSEETFSEEVYGEKFNFKSRQCGGKKFLINNGTIDREYLEDMDTDGIQLVFIGIVDPSDLKSLSVKINDPLADAETFSGFKAIGGSSISSIYITNECGNAVEFFLYAVGESVVA